MTSAIRAREARARQLVRERLYSGIPAERFNTYVDDLTLNGWDDIRTEVAMLRDLLREHDDHVAHLMGVLNSVRGELATATQQWMNERARATALWQTLCVAGNALGQVHTVLLGAGDMTTAEFVAAMIVETQKTINKHATADQTFYTALYAAQTEVCQ